MSKVKPVEINDDISLRDIADFVLRKRYYFVIAALCAAVGGVAQRAQRPRYITSASIEVQANQRNPVQALSNQLGGLGGGGNSAEAMESVKSQLTSEELYRRVAARILTLPDARKISRDLQIQSVGILSTLLGGARAAYPDQQSQVLLAGYLAEAAGVEVTGQDKVRVFVRAYSPSTAITAVNLIAELGVEMINESSVLEFNKTKAFVMEKLSGIEHQIKEQQKELVQIGKKMGLTVNIDLKSMVTPLTRLRNELSDAENERNERRRLVEEMKRRFDAGQTGYDVVTKYEKLQDEEKYWSAVADSRRKAIREFEASSKNTPNYEQDFQNKTRQIEFNYKFYADLKNQLLQTEMLEISVAQKVRIQEPGSEGSTLVGGTGLSYLVVACMAALLAMIMTGLGLYGLEAVHPKVSSRRDMEGLPVSFLGEIPDLDSSRFKFLQAFYGEPKPAVKPTHFLWEHVKGGKLIESPETMIFRNVRSKLLHLPPAKGAKMQMFCISSARPSEGKSMIAGNLACLISVLKKRVIILDCDLRCGGISMKFNVDGRKGLSDFLHSESKDYKSFLTKHGLGFDILPRGTECSDIVEILSGPKFADLLTRLRKDYDYIIMDLPPVLAVPETAIAAKNADLVVLSITQGQTRIEDAKHAIEDLSFSDVHRIGYVLNRCGQLSKETYFYGLKAS